MYCELLIQDFDKDKLAYVNVRRCPNEALVGRRICQQHDEAFKEQERKEKEVNPNVHIG